MFFLYGTGANGKSVFINTIAGMMGDYAVAAPMDTFIESKTRPPPDGASDAAGARLVVSDGDGGGAQLGGGEAHAVSRAATRSRPGELLRQVTSSSSHRSSSRRRSAATTSPALRNV